MSDLNTEIKIGADASGVEAGVGKAKRSLKDLGDAAQKAGKDAGTGIGSIGAGGDKAAKDVERATKNMQGSLQRLLAEQKAGAKGSREYYEALADTRGISRNAIKPILDQIDAAKSKTLQAKTAADSWTASLGKVGPLVAAAFSGAAITGFLGKVVSVQREFDVLNSSLKTVTGSSAAAEREMAWLKDFAKETPFGLAQATQGFVKMKALGLDPTRAALTSFGNTASAMGKDLNQMIEAVADASTGEFERLKEFGIKAKKEGDNVSLTFQGVTTTIKNSAAEITQYLENIGNVSFGGAMEERAKTLDGTIAALGDTWDELFRTVSTNNVGGLIFDSVTLANGALEDATTILRALGGAAQDAGRDTGALSTIQSGIATVFETVAVLGANLKFVLVGIGNEIGGLAAQVAQAAQFNFSGVAAIRRAMVADAEAARKEIDATTARILNARKAQEEYARYATRNASAATDPRRVDLGGSTALATGGVSSGAAKAVKEAISDYDKLIKKLSDELPKAAAEAEAAQHGYNKAQTEFLALAGSDVWAKFSNSERARVASLYEGKIASEQAGEAAKELSKAYAEAAAERIKTIQSMERAADSLQSQNDALRDEIELIGLSTEQQTLVLQQRNDVIILTKEATLAELERQSAITGTQTRAEIALASEIEALKERNALLGAKGVKNAAVDAAKTAKDEWQKTTDSINQTLTDALMRGFESGKDFAKNMRDTIVNMFKTLVLRPIISAVVNPVAGAVTGMMGMAGAANAGQSSAGSMAGSMGTSLLGSAVGGIGAFGTGASYGAASLFANGLGGTLAAGGQMIGAGSVMSGIGTIAGALGPIALGLAAVYAIVKGLDDSGTPHTGAGAIYSASAGAQEGAGIYSKSVLGMGAPDEYSAAMQKGMTEVARGMAVALDSTAKNFGKTAGYEITTAFADDSSKDGAWGALKIKLDGQSVLDWADTASRDGIPKEFANGEDGAKQYAAALGEGLRTALDSIGLPAWATKMLDSVGAGATVEQLAGAIDQINAAKAVFMGFGQYMPTFAGLAESAVDKLAAASGGVQALTGNMSAFVDNFYSDAEKLAINTQNVTDALAKLGFAMPATRDEFKALVQSQIALGDAGAQTAAGLLGLSGAFASVVSAETIAKAASDRYSEALKAETDARERATSAAQNLASTFAAWQSALQAVADYGTALQSSIDGTNAAINDLRNQAAQNLAGAQSAFVQAAAAIRDERDRTAAQVDAANDGVARAQSVLVSAIVGVSTVLQQQADAIKQARGRVDAALSGITQAYLTAAGGVESAQGRVDAAQAALTNSYLSAQGAYESAQKSLADLQRQSASSLRATADNIQSFLDDLSGTNTGSGSAGGQLAYNRALFDDLAQKAQAGDAASAARLTNVAGTLLQSSRAGAGSFAEFQGDDLRVRQVLSQIAAMAPAATKAADAAQAADPIAEATKAVADALAGLNSARDAALAADAPLVKAQTDLLAEYRAAVSDQVQAQALLSQATAAVQASGASTAAAQTDLLAEWRVAVSDLTGAQQSYDDMLARVSASGVELTLQASADALGGALGGVTAAQATLAAAQQTQTQAVTDAASAASAWNVALTDAVRLGVEIPAALSGLPAMQLNLELATAALGTAQAEFGAVSGALATQSSGTVEQYGALQTQLAGYVADLEDYRARIGHIDFADLVNTDELGLLLSDLNTSQTVYTAALAESAAAVLGLANASSAVSAVLLAAQPDPQATAQSASLQYLGANTDVAAAYAANSYGMGIDQFAAYHFQNYGMAEGRTSTFTVDDLQRLLIDGSHAGGLARVPFDGYVAELHQGERVLTEQEAQSYQPVDFGRYGSPGSDALVSEIRALRQQVADLRSEVAGFRADNSTENRAIKIEVADQAKIARKFDTQGMPPVRA